MNSKRTTFLMGVLLLVILGYVTKTSWMPGYKGPSIEPPLPGKNTVSALKVQQNKNGKWIADFDYFFTGGPYGAYLQVIAATEKDNIEQLAGNSKVAERGAHHVTLEIHRPWTSEVTTTSFVKVRLMGGFGALADIQISQNIDWPDYQTALIEDELSKKTKDEVLKHAVNLIDSGSQNEISYAKLILEHLLEHDTKFAPAYIELARVAMKSNWGPEGLHEAESLLSSAMQIQPDSVNAKILLGYVYTHQKRYKDAEKLFVEASGTDTKNLWLWANWGELLNMQGKPEQAMEKYRRALADKRPHDTYDRARLDAYTNMITLLEQRKDLDQIEALLKQRVAEFGSADCNCENHCFIAEYVRFLVQNRDDTSGSIDMGRKALESNCNKNEAREAMGLAYYAEWLHDNAKQPEGSLNQARVFLPPSPRAFYLLAGSERTAAILKKLVANGESLDRLDNQRRSALFFALENKDLPTARRLLKLGARPDAVIGIGNMPVALVPVANEDVDGIRLMRQFGVDYAKLRFEGTTAMEYAKKNNNRVLLEALDSKSNAL